MDGRIVFERGPAYQFCCGPYTNLVWIRIYGLMIQFMVPANKWSSHTFMAQLISKRGETVNIIKTWIIRSDLFTRCLILLIFIVPFSLTTERAPGMACYAPQIMAAILSHVDNRRPLFFFLSPSIPYIPYISISTLIKHIVILII